MKESAQAATLGSKSVALSNCGCKDKLLTSMLTEERTTPELWRSSSLFVDVFYWAVVRQDTHQWPDLPHAKICPRLRSRRKTRHKCGNSPWLA